MDSATTLYVARAERLEVQALSFDYGQRHRRELAAARAVARAAGVGEPRTVRLDLAALGGSALTDRRVRIPARRAISRGIPVTYVPARNTILLAFGLAHAEVAGADSVWIGANALDYSGYPDCRPEYFRAFQRLADLATKRAVSGRRVRVRAPLLRKTKAEIVRLGARLGVPFRLTWSCYRGGRRPCGTCDACRLRAKGFREAGLADPALAQP
jgi:7-cyano-7-deazaguanine synthase